MNRIDEAIGHLEKANKYSDPESAYQLQILQELAFSYSAKGMLDKALECIDRTRDLDCDHSDMEVLRGHILLENMQIEEAGEAFNQALLMSDNAPNVLLRIIVSLYDNKFVSAAYTEGMDPTDYFDYMNKNTANGNELHHNPVK